MLFFQRAGILNRPAHRVHGHQGLPAEKVNFDVPPFAGALHHKVDGLFGCFKVHGHPVAGAEVPCGGEAVPAAQIADVGHVEAQGFDHRRLGQRHSRLRVDILVGGEQQPRVLQLPQLFPGVPDLFGRILGQLFQQLRRNTPPLPYRSIQ